MCGFVGYVNKEKDKTKTIKLMNDMIIHRGPDSEGYYTDSDIAPPSPSWWLPSGISKSLTAAYLY